MRLSASEVGPTFLKTDALSRNHRLGVDIQLRGARKWKWKEKAMVGGSELCLLPS